MSCSVNFSALELQLVVVYCQVLLNDVVLSPYVRFGIAAAAELVNSCAACYNRRVMCPWLDVWDTGAIVVTWMLNWYLIWYQYIIYLLIIVLC